MRRIYLFTLSLFLALGLAHLSFGGLHSFFDIYPPEVVPESYAKFVGLNGFEFVYRIEDASGIGKIRYQLFQGKRKLNEKVIDAKRSRTTRVKLRIDPQKDFLRQGSYLIRVSAFDSSIRANRSVKDFEFYIDFTKPRITPITNMHNVRQGGVELLFYEVLNDASLCECVLVDKGRFFPGMPASNFGIQTKKAIKGSFFSLDISSPSKVVLVSYAKNFDLYAYRFPYLVLNLKPRLTRVSNLAFRKVNAISKVLSFSSSSFKFEDCESVAVEPCNFSSSFIKPVSKGTYYATFGQGLYSEIGNEIYLNADIFVINQTSSDIVSPFDGFIEDYDNQTLVINYGCGFRSHIYPVEYLQVPVRSKVKKNQVLGFTSNLTSDFIGHQISLWGHPVNNREWEDLRWVEDHVVKKVSFIKDLVATK